MRKLGSKVTCLEFLLGGSDVLCLQGNHQANVNAAVLECTSQMINFS